jgi:hypothetical protein
LYFQAAWTWSNLITDVSDQRSDLGPTIENQFDRRRDRGREPYSVRHRLNGSALWDLPFGRGRTFLADIPAVLNHFAGGWTVSTIFFFETGRWFHPTYSGRDISGTGLTTGRPDCIANGTLPAGERQISRWFDASAYSIPPLNSGRFGTCGVNILEGPGLNTQHLSLTKRLYEREHRNVEFKLSMLNVLNHANFNPPQANISNANTVGQITQTRRFNEVGAQASNNAGTAGRYMAASLRINF